MPIDLLLFSLLVLHQYDESLCNNFFNCFTDQFEKTGNSLFFWNGFEKLLRCFQCYTLNTTVCNEWIKCLKEASDTSIGFKKWSLVGKSLILAYRLDMGDVLSQCVKMFAELVFKEPIADYLEKFKVHQQSCDEFKKTSNMFSFSYETSGSLQMFIVNFMITWRSASQQLIRYETTILCFFF